MSGFKIGGSLKIMKMDGLKSQGPVHLRVSDFRRTLGQSKAHVRPLQLIYMPT